MKTPISQSANEC